MKDSLHSINGFKKKEKKVKRSDLIFYGWINENKNDSKLFVYFTINLYSFTQSTKSKQTKKCKIWLIFCASISHSQFEHQQSIKSQWMKRDNKTCGISICFVFAILHTHVIWVIISLTGYFYMGYSSFCNFSCLPAKQK